jgi:photosystem II oxygen-evolving enhancer protein 2
MLKKIIIAFLLCVSLTLYSCSNAVGNLQSYSDPKDGYEFLYPNGWIGVDVQNASEGVDAVFRDLIERSENLSVIISSVPKDQDLKNLGTATEVGYRFMKKVNSDPNNDREAELIKAESHEKNGKIYYILEYLVHLANNEERHNIASVAVNRGKLLTFNLSTAENRWEKVKNLFETVVNSFSVY